MPATIKGLRFGEVVVPPDHIDDACRPQCEFQAKYNYQSQNENHCFRPFDDLGTCDIGAHS